MFKLSIRITNHPNQRYDTVGDWWWEGDTLIVTVSNLDNPHFIALVAMHEVIEALLCRERGITEKVVTVFDVTHPELEEPGDDPTAPYHREHMIASEIERVMARMLDVKWEAYSEAFDELPEWVPEPGA